MAGVPRRQVSRWPASHAASPQNDIAFSNTDHLRQVVVHSVRILLDLRFIRLACLVKAISRELYSKHVHGHIASEPVDQVKGKPDVLSVPMKVNSNFVSTLLARQVQTRDVLLGAIHELLLFSNFVCCLLCWTVCILLLGGMAGF